jgi:hypothetical protein
MAADAADGQADQGHQLVARRDCGLRLAQMITFQPRVRLASERLSQPCRTLGKTSSASMCSSSSTRLCAMPGHCTLMIK